MATNVIICLCVHYRRPEPNLIKDCTVKKVASKICDGGRLRLGCERRSLAFILFLLRARLPDKHGMNQSKLGHKHAALLRWPPTKWLNTRRFGQQKSIQRGRMMTQKNEDSGQQTDLSGGRKEVRWCLHREWMSYTFQRTTTERNKTFFFLTLPLWDCACVPELSVHFITQHKRQN